MIGAIIVVSVMSLISLYITIGMIKYNTQLKKDERFNNRDNSVVNKERYDVKCCKEVSKDKVPNKRKPSRFKKKTTQSKKIK
tara:strand:- start:638 stop:883 length:246 start_codon:yes stop_codon:yes gene_type:complete